jgi:ERCC4-type nuclease
MKILSDTREQLPLDFNHDVIVQKLDVGDYGCQFKDGHIPNIFFDRKSISDLYGTMGKGYKRFKKCILRAQESDTTLMIIVEGSFTEVLKGYKFSQIRGVSMIMKLFTIWIRYGVMTVYCKDREEMSRYISEFYQGVGREYVRRK